MKILRTDRKIFPRQFDRLLRRAHELPADVVRRTRQVLAEVRRRGDAALLARTHEWDRHLVTLDTLEVSPAERQTARRKVRPAELAALRLAARRIEAFHRRQLPRSWRSTQGGITVGQQVRPLERVGLYVPGGKAAYPSTVLMNAIPAKVAGVPELIMVSPWPNGEASPLTLAAADLAGVDRIFKLGGAQAIAALAYGTRRVPAVDKIVGPGNFYVAAAKQEVMATVGIDLIAGPTEVVVVADETAPARFIAIDLLSQAEHDEAALPILITPSAALAGRVLQELGRELAHLGRQEILRKSLWEQGAILIARDRKEALALANQLAPEHLELMVKNPEAAAAKIRHAGAIFLGPYAPVALGDYLAGPNHVLPTGGRARRTSPLGVADFVKTSNLIGATAAGLKKLAAPLVALANAEGLAAHAASVKIRQEAGQVLPFRRKKGASR